jgi:alpha-D-ribose 1-methylphosphonate 5-triphosphate diphosphatase
VDKLPTSASETVVHGGKVLLPGQGLVDADLVIDRERIVEVRQKARVAGSKAIDAAGCFVLSGIIDIHGDAFERNIMPRPKTLFPLDVAMLETDRQLAANGITTAYHGVTISWEPGLRCLQQSLAVIKALDDIEPHTLVDHRLHIRWETYAIDEVPEVVALFRRAKKPVLAFNDHTTPGLTKDRHPSKYQTSAEKAMISVEQYLALLQEMGGRSGKVGFAIETVAAQARNHAITMLSHDDSSAEMRASYRELGARIAEFPTNWETAEAAAAAGDMIVLGAPNVVRGGSHNGAISAEDAIRRGLCHVLASDYYYPALQHAAFALVERQVLPLEQAWALVSRGPAQALGLVDRGEIAPGRRADLIIVDAARHQVVRTLSAGRTVFSTE